LKIVFLRKEKELEKKQLQVSGEVLLKVVYRESTEVSAPFRNIYENTSLCTQGTEEADDLEMSR